MMAMSSGVTLPSKAEGGIMKSLKRAALGGESFFVSTYTAPDQGGFVDIAARLPGDITHYTGLRPQALFVQKGSWLANEVNVTINTQWGGFKNMFGAEGGFIIRAEGQGRSCSPATARSRCGTSKQGQTHHGRHRPHGRLRGTVQMAIRKASGGGLVQSFKSGEGLVFDFTGPGRVWTQTRNPNELLGWIQSVVGHRQLQWPVHRRRVRRHARS